MGYRSLSVGLFRNWVTELYKKREYRPDILLGLYKKESDGIKFLVVKSAKANSEYSFPQEGAELNDPDIDSTIKRCLEEVNIDLKDLKDTNYFVDYGTVDFTNGRDHRGFRKGKAFLAISAEYTGNGSVRPDNKEVSNVHWSKPSEMTWIENKQPKKRGLLENIIAKVLHKHDNILQHVA